MPDNIMISAMLPVGAMLNGRYRIERYLSSGGFGNTYVAINEFGERVAIKEFFIKGVNQRDGNNTTVSVSNSENRDQFNQQREKFKKEAIRLRGLQSPHIVKVLSFFEENGTAYYVMDYIDGESLSQRLESVGMPMPEAEVSNILNQVLEALDEVHGSQPPLFHLDIKPGNIMLDSRSGVHLIDFGASKQMDASTGGATASTQASFTKGYAPLEQVEGRMDKIGPWTDFYALGATLFRLLTNQTPPQYSDIQDEGSAAFRFPDSVSQSMRDLIQWMMQPQRSRRPQSVAEVRGRLPMARKQNKQTAPPPVPPTPDKDVTIVNKQGSTSPNIYSIRINAKKFREWLSDPKQSGKRFAIKRLGITLFTVEELQGLTLYESDEIRFSTGNTWRHLGLLVNNYTRVAPAVSQTSNSGTTGPGSTNSNTASNSSSSNYGTGNYGTGTSSDDEQNDSSSTSPNIYSNRINAKKFREWLSDPKQSGKRFAIKRLGTTLFTVEELQGLTLYESDEIRFSTGNTWRHLGLLVNNYTRVAPAVSQTSSSGTTGPGSTNSNTASNSSSSNYGTGNYGTGTSSDDEQNNSSFLHLLIGTIVAGIIIVIAERGCTGTAEYVSEEYSSEVVDSAAAFVDSAASVAPEIGDVYYQDGSKYHGGVLANGEPSGKGVLEFADGTKYEGEFEKGTLHGKGIMTWTDGGRYEGEFENGYRHGKGIMTSTDGERYEGEFRHGEETGYGIWTYPEKRHDCRYRYEGYFIDGEFNGNGTAYYVGGAVERGTWKNGKLVSNRFK